MPKAKVELATQEQEQEPTQDALVAELDKASTEESETSATESVEKETEPEEGGKEKPEQEESFEEKLERLAQSKKDKELKPFYKERDTLKAKITELEGQLNDKLWDRELQSLFNEDVEKLGEDEATTRKTNRGKIAEQVKAFNKERSEVEKNKRFYDEALPKLGAIERDQKARNDVWNLIFPEDKDKVTKVSELIKKFAKAQDIEDYEIVLEGIRETVKAGRKPFVPDSGKAGGSGPKKGRRPTLEELSASHPDDTEKKVASGEWIL